MSAPVDRLTRRTVTKAFAAGVLAPSLALAAGRRSVARAQEPATVTFWQFSQLQFNIDAYNAAIAEFEKQNPDIKVNMELVPWADQHQKLVTGLTTGNLPDVSMLGNNVVAEFQALGALAPLTDYFKQWSDEIGRDITEDIWPGDKLYYNLHDDWWGSPVAEETRCIFYRRDLFDKAGLGETAPDTWDAMRDAAVALTGDGVFGWGIPGGINYQTLQTFMSVYLGYGARFLNDEGMCGFDSPEFREALTYYTNLYLADKVSPPDTPTYDREPLVQLFMQGKLGMYIDGPDFYASLKEANPEFLDSVGVAQIAQGPAGRFGFLGGWPLVMWNTSKNKDAAFKWIRFATDPDGYLYQLAVASGNLPGRKSLVDREPWTVPPLDVFAAQMEFAYPYQYPDPEIPQMGTLEVDAVQTAVQSVMLGQTSVDDATLALVDRINAVLSR
ncbi:MAG: sugar ABC transporter substrate-binding protein [Thermomicrobiales bacterium]|nr:sugar ABC transporter substrate-binding protein [Thermomicrobiales bacterium]